MWVARPERFELPTYSSGGCRSIQLSYGRAVGTVSVYIASVGRLNGAVRGKPRLYGPLFLSAAANFPEVFLLIIEV